MEKIQARATVRLTLEVDLSDRWGMGTMIQQVFQQGADGALNRIRKSLPPDVRIIGKPEVTAVIFPEI